MLNLDGLKINSQVFVAPMAGVTDYPYRQILREFGAEVLFTEMVSSQGLVQGNRRTRKLIHFNRQTGVEEGKIGVQLFGADPDIMAEAATIVEAEYQPDLIDINMGCPARKIVNSGYGSALLQKPAKAARVTEAVVQAVNLPVTVKIRLGWDEENITADEITEAAVEAGASAVAIHGRTRKQFYSGEADWQAIARIASSCEVPVIGNGDIFSAEDAREMLAETSCAGIMLARGIQGNPWLVKESRVFLEEGKKLTPPGAGDKISIALKHLDKAIEFYGEKKAIPLMRKHLAWYIKGLSHASKVRNRINKMEQQQDMRNLLLNYKNYLED